ncbi:MAG TPA: SpoIIE family protein phosphatase, partial [Anaerolineales bacterium]|nr:SpoIIE family protein phosphatase [Anaerolineales bacterium]
PQVSGVDIFATSIPAFEVGGDFFDVIDRSAESLIFSLGDVTGKGMPAALLMSMAHTIIKAASRNMPFDHPHQVLNRLNHDMESDFSNVGMFTTVMLGMVDCANCKLHFSNAGQSPIYYMPVNGDAVLLEAQDIPVGILDTVEYTTQSLSLAHGDLFVAASDGFPESRNPVGEMYGYERMKNILSASRQLSSKQIAEALLNDVNTFCETHPQDDDRTIIVLKFEKQNEKQIMFNDSLTVRANYEDIRQPCERLRTNLSQSGVSEEIAGLCELALQELLTNLVDHAYEGNLNGQITVRMASKNGQIFLQTEDTGLPARIKMEDVHMPNPEDLAEGGYGMAIIRSLMDDIRYESMQGKNIWTLIKNLK